MIKLLTLFIFTLQYFSFDNSYCSIIDDKIYYIGGNLRKEGKIVPNRSVFILDLTKENSLKKDLAGWKTKGTIDSPEDFEGAFTKAGKGSRLILFFGGKNLTVFAFDTKTLSWSIFKKINKGFKDTLNSKGIESIEGAQVVFDDSIRVIYYFGGNYKDKEEKSHKNDNLFLFNLTSLEWDKETLKYEVPYGSFSVLNGKGSILNFGGREDDGTDIPLDSMYSISLSKPEQKQVPLTIPEKNLVKVNPSYVQTEEGIFILGGRNGDNKVLYFKPKDENFDIYVVDKFNSIQNSCLVHYNSYLIYALGNENEPISNQTQVIDMITMKKVTSDTLNLNITYPLRDPAIYGAMLGGISGTVTGLFFIILSIIYFFYFKKSKVNFPIQ